MGLEETRDKSEELFHASAVAHTLEDALARTCAGRRVLVTGNTGFVGSWLAYLLAMHGAKVVGLSLPAAPEAKALRDGMDRAVQTVIGDINNFATVLGVVKDYEPEVIFHLAAQALVLPSYEQPLATMATNIIGTANVLEALRLTGCSLSCVVVTSDKCYAVGPRHSFQPHNESDPLGGTDPYSSSKAGAEIVTNAYWQSFGGTSLRAIATARGEHSRWRRLGARQDRAGLGRSVRDSAPLHLRQPEAVRPWQHVLDAVAGYVLLADALAAEPSHYAGAWNFGPAGTNATTVQELVEMFQRTWTAQTGQPPSAIDSDKPNAQDQHRNAQNGGKERLFLALDSTKAREALGWSQRLDLSSTVEWTAEWYAKALLDPRADLAEVTAHQINRYIELCGAGRTSGTG